jgi:hypothetical protein
LVSFCFCFFSVWGDKQKTSTILFILNLIRLFFFVLGTFSVLYAGGLFYGAFEVERGTATAGDVFGAFFG